MYPNDSTPKSDSSSSGTRCEGKQGSNSGLEGVRDPKTKPALLPKPQISPLDLRLRSGIARRSLRSSETQTSNLVKKYETSEFTLTASVSLSKKTNKITPKPDITIPGFGPEITPPKISPKPQLPPKTVLKSKSFVCESSPIRPPRSPKRTPKTNPLDALKDPLSPSQWKIHKQKSASLSRNDNFEWTLANSPIPYYQQGTVVQCIPPKLPIQGIPVPRPRVRNKPKLHIEQDLATSFVGITTPPGTDVLSPIYATVDYSKKKNRRLLPKDMNALTQIEDYYSTNESFETRRSSDSNDSFKSLVEFQESDYLVAASLVPVNGMNATTQSPTSRENALEINQIEPDIVEPDSFLHRHTREKVLANEKEEEAEPSGIEERGAEPITSTPTFLHRDVTRHKLEGCGSFEVIDEKDCVFTDTLRIEVTEDVGSDQSLQALLVNEGKQDDDSSPREPLSRVGSTGSEDSGTRWFWNIGQKRNKEKKERCASQFYTTSKLEAVASEIVEQPRAVSLPDIQHADNDSEARCDREGSCSTAGEYSLYHHSDSDEDKYSLHRLELGDKDSKQDKPFMIAKEIATSEQVFINVLKLLNVHFRNYIEFKNSELKTKILPDAEMHKILNYLPELQRLNEDILTDFKFRIDNWETNPKIADIIVKKGAFLKMYTSYIQNFASQTKYLDECISKYPKFGKAVQEFEMSDRCQKLSLKHYMLKPIQRIPQYRLLLGEYEKNIDSSSPDYNDTMTALKIVCDVADHANRSMKFGDKNGRMLHFQSLLSDYEIIKPGRELVKDGALEKICRKTVKERYFILLNDCLLHTTYSKNYLKIHQSLPLSGMKVCLTEEEKYPFTFTIFSITKSFILCAKSEEERLEWVETLQETIDSHVARQKSFMNVKTTEVAGFKLGKKAPVWIQDNKVTMCQICTAEFTPLFRRHHCRGCGKVICRGCGNNQAPIQYRGFKADRVCDQCFFLLFKEYEETEESICEVLKEMKKLDEDELKNEYLNIKTKFVKSTTSNSWKKKKYIPQRLIEVSANTADSVMRGWLHRRSRKSWKLFWYVLKQHVLYVYRASEDVVALETVPVLGYTVIRPQTDFEEVDKGLVFVLNHKQQPPIVFHADSSDIAERWSCALQAATNFTELG